MSVSWFNIKHLFRVLFHKILYIFFCYILLRIVNLKMNDNYNAEIIRILNNNYEPSIRWSNRCPASSYQTSLKEKIKRFLLALSGNDLISMLNDVLDKNEVALLKYAKMHIDALRNMSQAINNTQLVKPKSKHHFIRPFRLSELSLPQVKKLGVKCSNDLWKSCLDVNERHLAGRPKIANILLDEIRAHMDNLSNIGANRLIVMRSYLQRNPYVPYKKIKDLTKPKKYINVRYRQTTITEAFRLFKSRNNDHLDEDLQNKIKKFKLQTFRKNLDKKYKKPTKFTDLCSYCETGKDYVKQIKQFTNFDFIFDTKYELNLLNDHLLSLYRENEEDDSEFNQKVKICIQKVGFLSSIQWHKKLADRQRRSYNRDRLENKLFKDRIVIELDFKSAIILGSYGPRQIGEEYFQGNKQRVNCLGFGIYYLKREFDGKEHIECLNIDIISDSTGTTSSDVIRFFRHLRTLDIFKAIDKPNYTVWCDTGSNLRSIAMAHYYFNELADEGIAVNLNFFAEKHVPITFYSIKTLIFYN
jgi:hypothetical protein